MRRVIGFIALAFCSSCLLLEPTPQYTGIPAYLYTPSAADSSIAVPSRHSSWHIQYTDTIDLNLDVDVYNLDLFDTDSASIAQLRARGVFVMCYFNAGAYEDWRPDIDQFPMEVLGKPMEGWDGEKWVDIRQINLLSPVMLGRLDLAVKKGCNGVDPDNVNGYVNDTGFSLTYQDQISFNEFLSIQAHKRGLAIGLKNDNEQINELLPYFDWAINEQCFYYKECQSLQPFVNAGKPVFVIEYELNPEEFCPQAKRMKFNVIQKKKELNAFSFSCG